jgi:hypothetical protein
MRIWGYLRCFVVDTLWSSTKDTENASGATQDTDALTNKEKEEMRPSYAPITMSLLFILTASLMLAMPAVLAADLKPTEGWTLHIDAKRHFPSKPNLLAHHYCKEVSGGLTECLIYDSDGPDAKLVGVEVIVSPETYKTFSAAEKARWHYHKTEIPKVSATLPDLSPEEAAKVVKEIEGTYEGLLALGSGHRPASGRTAQPKYSEVAWRLEASPRSAAFRSAIGLRPSPVTTAPGALP